MDRNDQPQHVETVDLSRPEEIGRWTARFHVSEERLRELIDEVGPVADRIEWQLMQERGLVKGDPTPDS